MSVPSGSAGGLQPMLEQLGMHQAASVLAEWLDRAAQELSYADCLQGLLEEESSARANAATQKRLRQAGFPYAATIEPFDFRFRPELKRQVVLRYLDPTFVEQARSLALIGPPGLGKTMLAICVATKHIQLGATARFITAQHLANQLGRATSSLGRQRVLRPLVACDVLVLDELGYLPTLPGFGPALYELIAGRFERRPTLPDDGAGITGETQALHTRAGRWRCARCAPGWIPGRSSGAAGKRGRGQRHHHPTCSRCSTPSPPVVRSTYISWSNKVALQ
jgi:DNA replication protein DnaC